MLVKLCVNALHVLKHMDIYPVLKIYLCSCKPQAKYASYPCLCHINMYSRLTSLLIEDWHTYEWTPVLWTLKYRRCRVGPVFKWWHLQLVSFSSSLTLIWGPHMPCMQAHINAITLNELHPMNTFLNFNFFSLVHFSKWFFSLFAKDYHGPPCMTTACHAEDIKEKVPKQSLSIRMTYGLFLSTYLSLFSCYDKTPWPRQRPYLP